METEFVNANHLPHFLRRAFPAVGPGLLIAIGYVDPGKWAATVEGGARFGFDLVLPMLIFNFVAILCQYLSARIGVVTGKDLAQVSSYFLKDILCFFHYFSLLVHTMITHVLFNDEIILCCFCVPT